MGKRPRESGAVTWKLQAQPWPHEEGLAGGVIWEQSLLRSRAKTEFLFWGCLHFLFGVTASKGNLVFTRLWSRHPIVPMQSGERKREESIPAGCPSHGSLPAVALCREAKQKAWCSH